MGAGLLAEILGERGGGLVRLGRRPHGMLGPGSQPALFLGQLGGEELHGAKFVRAGQLVQRREHLGKLHGRTVGGGAGTFKLRLGRVRAIGFRETGGGAASEWIVGRPNGELVHQRIAGESGAVELPMRSSRGNEAPIHSQSSFRWSLVTSATRGEAVNPPAGLVPVVHGIDVRGAGAAPVHP